MGRSILAVLAGWIFIGVTANGSDIALGHFFPQFYGPNGEVTSVGVLLFILLYSAIFGIAGCYLTAALAPRRPMRHALILGGIGLAMSIMFTIQLWATAPAWFHLINIVMMLPYAWLGGRLYEKRHPLKVAV